MDLRTLYTPREAAQLYNLNRIKFNPSAYSLKGNLVLSKDTMALMREHITHYNYDAEHYLKNQLLAKGLCARGNLYYKHTLPTTPLMPIYVADVAAVKQDSLSIALDAFSHIDMKHFKGTPIADAIVRMFIALSSPESCVNELYWLETSLYETTYEDLHNFNPLKNALKTKGTLPVELGLSAGAYISNPMSTDKEIPEARECRLFKAYIHALEVVWAYKRMRDPVLQKTLAWWITECGGVDNITKHLFTVDKYGLYADSVIDKLTDIDSPSERFTAYQKFLKAEGKAIDAMVDTEALRFSGFNPATAIFISFAEACGLTHVRVNNLRILYNYAKENGALSTSDEDILHRMMSEEGESLSLEHCGSGESEAEVSRDRALMDLHKTPSGAGGAGGMRSDDSAVFEALDKLNAKFKAERYTFEVRDVRVTSESSKLKYNDICSKVSLVNKNLIKRIKDIKTYNTGGKNSGKPNGKLDRKALFKYKYDPNIFYDNTYKTLESDLAFGIVLDISGSMSGSGIKNGRVTMVILHETLKALGINHSIIGHTNYGPDYSVAIERYQSFREDKTYTLCKNYALADLEARSGNCDSGALYYMEKALDRVKNKDKICLMFSDGAPTECTGTDLIEQVKKMERKGIKVIGIGINFPNIAKYYTDYANGRNLKDMLDIVSNILQEYILKKKET